MKIIKVTPNNIDNFNKEIKTPNLIAFVKIYRDTCGHCKDLEPKWTQLENELKNEDIKGLIASLPSEHLEDADCDTDIQGVPTLRIFEGGKRKMDYEGKRETADMKLFFKNLLKTKKGGRRKYRKKRTKNKRKRKRRKRGGFCLTDKCKKEREKKLEKKKSIQIHKDFENERYKLAWEVCDTNDKTEYDTCVNKIVGKSTVDDLIKDIDFTKKSNKLKQPSGMHRRTTPLGLHRKTTPPGLSQGGKRKRKTRKKRSRKRKSRKKRKTRRKRKSRRRK